VENPQLSGPGRIARDNNQKKRGGALIEVRCSHRGSDRRTSLSTPAARPTKQTISGKKPKIFVRGSIDTSRRQRFTRSLYRPRSGAGLSIQTRRGRPLNG